MPSIQNFNRRLGEYISAKFGWCAAKITWRGLRPFIERNLRGMPAGTRILNVGSGGRVATAVEDVSNGAGLNVVSLDIDAARDPDIIADITNFIPDEPYDAILIIEVLEHVKDPRTVTKNLLQVIRPGGTVILSAPFLFPIHDQPHDFYRYTKYGLLELFRDFEQVEISKRDSWAEVHCVLLARLIREKSLGARVVAPFFLLIAMISFPIALLLSKMVTTEAFTVGYMLTAKRPE